MQQYWEGHSKVMAENKIRSLERKFGPEKSNFVEMKSIPDKKSISGR